MNLLNNNNIIADSHKICYDKCATGVVSTVFNADNSFTASAASANVDEAVNKHNNATATDIVDAIGKTEAHLPLMPSTAARRVAPISKVFIDDLTANRQSYIWRIPWFILIMCFIQISLYAIANECIYQHFMFIPAQRSQYWRYFTYTLLHSDLIHLLLNICLQCLIGFCLESEQGHWKVAVIYVAGGIFGSLATAMLQPQLSLLGASAGVYAMLMSHIPHLIKNFTHLPHRYLRIVALVTLCLSDIGFTAFHVLVNRNANPRICLEAHIAGGVSGLFLGFLLYSGRRHTSVGCGCCA